MGSRNREQQQQTAPHQPLLSSLVVRLIDNERTADFEPTEINRDPPSFSHRSARFYQDPQSLPSGYRVHAGSVSLVHRRNADHHSSFDHSGGMSRRGPGRENDTSGYRESPPLFSQGRGSGRGFAGHGSRPGPVRDESTGKSNPKIQPREGDWYCSDPGCRNLNFARRDHCYNCHQSRRGTEVSPRRGHPPSPPPHVRCYSGMDYSPRRVTSGYRSPPRVARGFGIDLPRNRDRGDDRSIDHHLQREQPGHLDNGFDTRSRFDRREPPVGFTSRKHTRDSLFNDRKGYSRRLQSPPPYSFQEQPAGAPSRWARDRSRSPIILRDELPVTDYRCDTYMERGRNERHDALRNHVDELPPLSTLQHSSPAAPARWTRQRNRSPLPVSKDFQRDACMSRGRDDRHGMARGGREPY